mmetsp:Transcript_10268/g.17227  ORF Transcript_10268/g.17227 Transcript_10268/m.17227 type:complete len:236 (-) Transcript_10268:62-769(-)
MGFVPNGTMLASQQKSAVLWMSVNGRIKNGLPIVPFLPMVVVVPMREYVRQHGPMIVFRMKSVVRTMPRSINGVIGRANSSGLVLSHRMHRLCRDPNDRASIRSKATRVICVDRVASSIHIVCVRNTIMDALRNKIVAKVPTVNGMAWNGYENVSIPKDVVPSMENAPPRGPMIASPTRNVATMILPPNPGAAGRDDSNGSDHPQTQQQQQQQQTRLQPNAELFIQRLFNTISNY